MSRQGDDALAILQLNYHDDDVLGNNVVFGALRTGFGFLRLLQVEPGRVVHLNRKLVHRQSSTALLDGDSTDSAGDIL